MWQVSELEAEKQDGEMRTQSLVTVNEDTAANPDGGVEEYVPATVVAPVPGPPDWNGASAVVARLPNIGFAPSMLTEKGFETRGSFTVRQSRAGESFYLRVYGKLNHNIRCTLRGYRDLMGDFTGTCPELSWCDQSALATRQKLRSMLKQCKLTQADISALLSSKFFMDIPCALQCHLLSTSHGQWKC